MERKIRWRANQGEEETIKTKEDPYPNAIVSNAHPILVNDFAVMVNRGSQWRTVESRICKTPIARLIKTIKWNVFERRLWVLFTVAVIGGYRIPPMEMRLVNNPALKTAF